ncbi:HigA family addiction module antitoxin [Pseudazoarcus pumilus]
MVYYGQRQLARDVRVQRRKRLCSGLRGLSLMAMHNPPHPGEFITDIYLEPNGISGRELADKLDVAASTLSRVLKGSSRVTPEMALRLSKAIGRSPESWLAMQDTYDLWLARQSVDLQRVGKLKLAAA